MGDRTGTSDGTPPARDESATELSGDLVGRFYAWWRGDALPAIRIDPAPSTEPIDDALLVADATGMDVETVRERMRRGHQPWLARLGSEIAGWGWVASREAGIPELGIAITLQPGERYLWDFVTRPDRRNRGVYSALLHTILLRAGAERYWIGHDEGNMASARGIENAGFRRVGTARRMEDGRIVFVPGGPPDRADAAAALLGLAVLGS